MPAAVSRKRKVVDATLEDIAIQTPADKKWGFVFGVAGFWSVETTAEFFNTSPDTIYRMRNEGVFRSTEVDPDPEAKRLNRVMICRMSIEKRRQAIQEFVPSREG